jgi:hypothetical protein
MSSDWVVYTRRGCHLCDDFITDLELWCRPRGLEFQVLDVDADPTTREAYGDRIPVLVSRGEVLQGVRFDPDGLSQMVGEAGS